MRVSEKMIPSVPLWQYKSVQISFVVYILIQGFLLIFSNWNIHLEADAGMYYENALSFVKGTEYPILERQPLFPLFMSLTLFLFGAKATWAPVLSQMILLIGMAFIASRTAGYFKKSTQPWVFILVLLNPVAINHSHILITETFYAFLASCVMWCLVSGCYEKKWLRLMGAGFFLGGMALTRPEARYILYLVPGAIILGFIVVNGWKSFSLKLVVVAGLSLGVGYVVTLPWQFLLAKHHLNAGGTSGQKQFDHLSWSAAVLENLKVRGTEIHDSYYGHTLPRGKAYIASLPHADQLSDFEKKSLLNWFYVKEIFSYSPLLIGRAFLQSWTVIFVGSGNQYLMKLLNLKHSVPIGFQHMPNILSRLWAQAKNAPVEFLISVPLWLITLVVRILGLVGLTGLVRNRDYACLALTVPPVVVITLLFLFDGHSRVRLPLEPILMFWAAYGVLYLKNISKKKKGALL